MNRLLRRTLTLVAAGFLTLVSPAVPATAEVPLTMACSPVSTPSFISAQTAVCLYRQGDRWWATGFFWYDHYQRVLDNFSVRLSHAPLWTWEATLTQGQCGPTLTRNAMTCSTPEATLPWTGMYVYGRVTIGLDLSWSSVSETFTVRYSS